MVDAVTDVMDLARRPTPPPATGPDPDASAYRMAYRMTNRVATGGAAGGRSPESLSAWLGRVEAHAARAAEAGKRGRAGAMRRGVADALACRPPAWRGSVAPRAARP
jgi:hypothetical protein